MSHIFPHWCYDRNSDARDTSKLTLKNKYMHTQLQFITFIWVLLKDNMPITADNKTRFKPKHVNIKCNYINLG